MAQVSRALRKSFLLLCPTRLRMHLLNAHPNLRKAAPAGMKFVYFHYLGSLAVNIDTKYKVERIMWTGIYEAPLVRWLEGLQTKGWTCFDVGANVGAITLVLGRLVGNEGKVYAFEPGLPNLSRLKHNFQLNPELMPRVHIVPVGVGETAGELWWSEEKANPGNALLSSTGTQRTYVISLDDFVKKQFISRVDFIKIDVEGMELDVMRGAAQLLRTSRPAIYFETLDRYLRAGGGAVFADFKRLLVGELGYGLFKLNSSGKLSPLTDNGNTGYTVAVHPQNPAILRA